MPVLNLVKFICYCALTVGCWFQTRKNNQGRASYCGISIWHRSMECVDSRCSGNKSVQL